MTLYEVDFRLYMAPTTQGLKTVWSVVMSTPPSSASPDVHWISKVRGFERILHRRPWFSSAMSVFDCIYTDRWISLNVLFALRMLGSGGLIFRWAVGCPRLTFARLPGPGPRLSGMWPASNLIILFSPCSSSSSLMSHNLKQQKGATHLVRDSAPCPYWARYRFVFPGLKVAPGTDSSPRILSIMQTKAGQPNTIYGRGKDGRRPSFGGGAN